MLQLAWVEEPWLGWVGQRPRQGLKVPPWALPHPKMRGLVLDSTLWLSPIIQATPSYRLSWRPHDWRRCKQWRTPKTPKKLPLHGTSSHEVWRTLIFFIVAPICFFSLANFSSVATTSASFFFYFSRSKSTLTITMLAPSMAKSLLTMAKLVSNLASTLDARPQPWLPRIPNDPRW